MRTVLIDTGDNLLYKSFYIRGLEQIFGKNNVHYSRKPFASLKNTDTRGIAFIINDNGEQVKYFIHCNDTYHIIEEIYDWCDIYGHCNANRLKTPAQYQDKLVSLCPSFGIRCWSPFETIAHLVQSTKQNDLSFRKIAGQHKRMLQRSSYDNYLPELSSDDYIFFLSTLWYNDQWNNNDSTVNASRANFIRACKNVQAKMPIQFEGGLLSQGKERSSEGLFRDCLASCYLSSKQYLQKAKQSAVVFNTPAFWQCHGWKLGEFLALGKAIISTELSNDLPAPLIHGQHIHYVENNQEAMEEALLFILTRPEYRHRLEVGAHEYWDQYGSPKASLKLLGII